MKNRSSRGGGGSTALLVVLLLTALVLAAGLYFLAKEIVISDFDLPRTVTGESAPQAGSAAAQETDAVENAEPETYVISMIGDCTLASSQLNNDYENVLAAHDLAWPFSGTVQILAADDFTLANLECSFSDARLQGSTTFYFCGPTENAAILTAGSVECVTNGNNHTTDFGERGMTDTKATVEAEGVGYVAANDAQIFTTESGLKVGVYCPGWRNCSVDGVNQSIPALREAGADIVIYAPHWGVEGSYKVGTDQELVAHAAIDAGADVVCGTHPHVLQRMEAYNGGYIFYSLGNWSFGGNTAPRDRDTAIAQVTVTRAPDGTCAVTGYTLIPCCLSSTPGVNDYRPEPYAEDSDEYARTLSKLDGTFTGPDLVVDYSFLNG